MAPGEPVLSSLILNSTLDAVIIIDAAGIIHEWNGRAESLFGWISAEAVGQPMGDLIIPPRYREAHNRGLSHFLATGEGPILGRRMELTGLRRDGEEFPVELTVSAASIDGKWMFIGFLRDQTAEKKNQGRLQVQNAIFRILSESPTPESMDQTLLAAICNQDPWLFGATWRPDGGILRCTAVSERSGQSFPLFRARTWDSTFGRGEGLPGKVWEDLQPKWTADFRGKNLARLDAAENEGLHAAFALPVLVRQQVAIIFEFFSRGAREPDADLISFSDSLAGQIGLYLERKAAEDEVQRKERRLSAILDFTPSPMVLVDPDTRKLVFANKAAHVTARGAMPLGMSASEFPEDNYLTDADGRRIPREDDPSMRAARGETLTDLELIWHVAGSSRALLINSATLRGKDGSPETIVIAFQDLTHLKQVEEQLRQSQKMEAIGQLAGGIAHDFNNLLTAINGYSSMALEKLPSGDPLHGFMSEVLRSGERAAGLTRQLLAYSRKQVLETKLWDLNSIVSEMQAMLRRIIGEDIILSTRLAAGQVLAKVDRGQVEQILLNLSLNSRDAMPRGGKLILETRTAFLHDGNATLSAETGRGPHVVLSVTDTGSGMPPEVKARIFEPFYTTKEVGKGTGLGLSSVYGIVKQSGGSITVRSEPGQGTTFHIYFPEATVESHRAEEIQLAPPDYRGTETILLVEDEEAVRRFAAHALEVKGYTVLRAANGREALGILARRQAPIALVVTDVVMPDVGGQVLADRLRELHPDLPILFISGYTDSSVIHKGLMDRPGGFLQKPFGPTDLARSVREALDGNTKVQRVTEKKASE